ncbi:hypothetical protein QF035_000514 [Streptomyces umbrinus]|uniref:Uncharacterized protein n=1 Tax=Streptomyces umbrinus TaxID=67370 RepID=A0ABU0SHM2_9ACTN|nr:hypothetical protein [Streptomyces umbrinus]MDQ1022932.1 hypothetical protein [Streptomyces umbrinus]
MAAEEGPRLHPDLVVPGLELARALAVWTAPATACASPRHSLDLGARHIRVFVS